MVTCNDCGKNCIRVCKHNNRLHDGGCGQCLLQAIWWKQRNLNFDVRANFNWIDLQVTNFIYDPETGEARNCGFNMDNSTHQVSRCPACNTLYMLTQKQWRRSEFMTMLNNDGIRACKSCDHFEEWFRLNNFDLPEIRERVITDDMAPEYVEDRLTDFVDEYLYGWAGFDEDYYMGDLFPLVNEVREFKGLRHKHSGVGHYTRVVEYTRPDYQGNKVSRHVLVMSDRQYPRMESLL